MIVFDAARYIVAAKQTVERFGSAEQPHVAVITKERVCIFHVVAVVMCQKNSSDGSGVDAIVKELFGDVFAVDAGIDQYSAFLSADKGAVAAAAAAERYEL